MNITVRKTAVCFLVYEVVYYNEKDGGTGDTYDNHIGVYLSDAEAAQVVCQYLSYRVKEIPLLGVIGSTLDIIVAE